MPPDNQSTNSSVRHQELSDAETQALIEDSDKSITMHLTGEQYSITYKGKAENSELTLLETIKMWGHMTDWLLTRADDLTQGDSEDVRKYVLSTLVSKLTHECELQRTKEQAEESVIITP